MTGCLGVSETNGSAPSDGVTLRLSGGVTTPRRARAAVLSWLDSTLTDGQRSDVGLIVSELVTNSVVHANVGSDETLTVEASRREDSLRIAVTDAGSHLEPHLVMGTDGQHGQLGLFLVAELSSAWGFDRDHAGTTCVWCEVPFDSH